MARATAKTAEPKGKAATPARSAAKAETKAPAKTRTSGKAETGAEPKAAAAKAMKAAAPPPAKASGKADTKAATKKTIKAVAPPPAAKPARAPVVTLKHLAAGISERRGLPRRDAEAFAAELIGDLLGRVKEGARVKVAGLGTLEIRDRPARMARNPATGAPVQVAASRKVVFRPAKELKDLV